MTQTEQQSPTGASFREGYVEADGFRIRYMEGGDGPPLVHLHGAGGPRLTRAHDLLSRQFRVIDFEMPGFGQSPENTRTRSIAELAATMTRAVDALGVGRFNLWGTSFGGTTAVWLAVQAPERLLTLVLEAPAAFRQPGAESPAGTPEEMARRLYAHPERVGPLPATDPAARAKMQSLVKRLRGPDRDPDLEQRLRSLTTPTLVLFGTMDAVIDPSMGPIYKELIPGAHLIYVYDAGHAIGAERPEAFTEVVADFVHHGESFVIRRSETLIHP